MKKAVAMLLCLVMTLSCLFSIPSQALTIDYNNMTAMQIVQEYSDVVDYIVKGLESQEETINIKEFQIEQANVDEIYKSILVEKPELFYVNPYSLRCSVSASTGLIVSLIPAYNYSEKELPGKIREFEEIADSYLKGVKSSWSDYKKCRYIHDMIINNCEYDVNYVTGEVNSRTASGVFFDKTAVCQGYTLAFNYLVKRLGIEAHFVESYTVNHAWSMVKLNKKYYHVDVTWDDPTSDLTGRILHSYFLISDQKLSQLESIRKWHSNMKANDTTYDNAWWGDIRSFIYTVDNKDYYIDQKYSDDGYGALMCYDENANTRKCVYKIADRWYENSEKRNYWQGSYSCIAYDGSKLYFNTPMAVYSIKADGTDRTKCYSNPSTGWKPVYGLAYTLAGKYVVELQNNPMSKDGEVVKFTPKTEPENDNSSSGGNSNSGTTNDSTASGGTTNSSTANKSTTTKKLKLSTPKITVKGSKKTITVKYTKVKNATGFQLKYVFGKKTVSKSCNTKKNTTVTIKKLKKGTYKVYLRAFAKQGKTKVYSSWTKVKKVKVK